MIHNPDFTLRPIGIIRSTVKLRSEARSGSGRCSRRMAGRGTVRERMLEGLNVGDEVIVISWLHQARRETFKVHPRADPRNQLSGVFATGSPDRPNPLGLHHVTIKAIEGSRLQIGPMEAIDGTPVVDIEPVLSCKPDR